MLQKSRKSGLIGVLLIIAVLASVTVYFIVEESSSSYFQARTLAELAKDINTEVVRRSSSRIRFPKYGPYDTRLGYTQIEDFTIRLLARGFKVTRQAQISPTHARLIDMGIFPQYSEKDQAGLELYSGLGVPIVKTKFPKRVFKSFHEIPRCVVDALLFIEDKHVLTRASEFHNPAIEWDRFVRAVSDVAISKFSPRYDVHGGSTLATQIEKFRHSREGRTQGVKDKLRQMTSAALRSYRYGASNQRAREGIVLTYINSVPLAAIRGYGEVNGLGDGLWAYYRVKFDRVKSLLKRDFKSLDPESKRDYASVYRRVLSLFLAHRRPSEYLSRNPDVLERQVQKYLPLMAERGIIDAELAEIAAKLRVDFRTSLTTKGKELAGRKTQYTMRSQLLGMLGLDSFYELDRLDLEADSTLDMEVQEGVVSKLEALTDKKTVRSNGLYGSYLLKESNDLSKVITSVTIYEKTPIGNLLRVQADNYGQPLNISEGVKLDLGSTSKLRTLITYLQVIEEIFLKYRKFKKENLKKELGFANDPLTEWVIRKLLADKKIKLRALLDDALDRRYSASPAERFFTAGGLHTFHNFNRKFDSSVVSMRLALRHSINLPFIRLMRDLVRYYSQFVGVSGLSTKVIRGLDDEVREGYLRKFADREGRKFMRGFYKRYASKNKDEIVLEFQRGTRLVDKRFAAFAWEILEPESEDEFYQKLIKSFPEYEISKSVAGNFYQTFERYRDVLSDRSYIARIHPLELWVAAYLYKNPGANFKKVVAAGKQARQDAYRWLFVTRHQSAQDKRIRIIVESEAFQLIHKEWVKLGFPHSFLVPSYASALGVSADTPDALAKLMGILLNDGKNKPYFKMSELHFAVDTPFETQLRIGKRKGKQVISSTIAEVIREAARDVVSNGTAVRIRAGLSDGKVRYKLGGKTGTGDHRHMVYRKGKAVVAEVRNRSANFIFFIDEYLFGSVTIFVPGKDAADYSFTSSLAVQILRYLEPELAPLLRRSRKRFELRNVSGSGRVEN